MQRAKQISESIELGAILALAGGFMDAYSYIGRGGVFANAQTGNILWWASIFRSESFPKRCDSCFPLSRLPWASCFPI